MRLDRSGVRVRRAIPITLAVLATVQIPLTCVLHGCVLPRAGAWGDGRMRSSARRPASQRGQRALRASNT